MTRQLTLGEALPAGETCTAVSCNLVVADLQLPYPPSVNELWRSTVMCIVKGAEFAARMIAADGSWSEARKMVRANVYLSRDAKAYRERVAAAMLVDRVSGELPEVPFLHPLSFRAIASPPATLRTRDVDNLLKAILDALKYAEVYRDDSQFDDIRIRWGNPTLTPGVRVVLAKSRWTHDADWLHGSPMRAQFAA